MSTRRRLLQKRGGGGSIPNYLCFTALESGTFTLTIGAQANVGNLSYIEYSLDGGTTWTKTNNVNSTQVVITTPSVSTGDKVYWRGSGVRNSAFRNGSSTYFGVFSSTCRFDVSGNVCSYLFLDDFENKPVQNRAFVGLFIGCSTLNDASELVLPTSFGDDCFTYMFQGCTGLVLAPQLQSTTLTSYCYQQMFYGCSSLVSAPSLPATIMKSYCYQQMFYGCSSLVSAPSLNSTSLAERCYENMFYNCSNLTSAPSLPATTLASYCYCNMFYGCSSLTTAPQLSATTLANNCYAGMFRNCRNLVNVQNELPATTLASYCYSNMFYGCSSLTYFVKLPATTLQNACYEYMFYGSGATGSIELPALTLLQGCYQSMLRCNPTYIKMLATDISASNCLNNWLYGVGNQSSRIFVKHIDANWTTTGNSGVPTNWTIIYYDPAVDKYYTDQTRATECDDHGNPI